MKSFQIKSFKVALVSGLLFLTACPSIGQLLQMYGYTELRPPSTFFAPGTMVWVQNKNPFTAGIICTQQTSLGPNFAPMVSPTEDATLTKASSQSFLLDANYMDIVHADIAFDAVQSITAQIQNPLVYVLSDVDILNNIGKRDPVCTQAIEGRRAAGYKVTMISQALMGDVVYTVEYKTDAKLDAGAKLAMLQNLALALKIENATLTETSISGKGLFWGVQDDTYLASLGDPNAADTAGNGNGRRLIPADATPNLVYQADAE
jgi:hypothetical protein